MSAVKNDLLEKLQSGNADIGVIGLGYVGLPLALRFCESGYRVTGFDVDPTKPENILAGKSYISHIDDGRVASARESGLDATTDFSRIADMDAVILCVPTPLHGDNSPDLSFVINTTETICPFLRTGQVVSLESTTYPGTTEEELLPRIEALGLEVGTDVFLVYSPEREDPGNPDFQTRSIPKLCGGHTPDCLEIGRALYGRAIDDVVAVSSTRVAEMAKLLENIYRAVNIGMVNEMKMVADRMDIDIHEVIRAASTKPFGFTPFYPGPGLGGHCLPIDPFYLSWKARQCGAESSFIELAGKINRNMPSWVIDKTRSALEIRGLELESSSVLILGVAYKKNIDDMRESPAIEIIQQLRDIGARTSYADPYVPKLPAMRNYSLHMESIDVDAESLSNHDAVILVTDHDCFDYALIAEHASLVVDTRGRYPAGTYANVVPA